MKKKSLKMMLPFIFLVIICVIPMVAGYVVFKHSRFFSLKSTAHGQLLSQAINFADFETISNKKWQVLFVGDECCNAICQKKMHDLQQLQKALGKNEKRIVVGSVLPITCEPLKSDKVISYRWSKDKIEDLLDNLTPDSENNFKQSVVIVDPLGNLFIYYAADGDTMFILKDMKKLLEASQIG